MSINHKQLTELFIEQSNFEINGKTCHVNGKRTFLSGMKPILKEFFDKQMLANPDIYALREDMPVLLSRVFSQLEEMGEKDEETFELPFELEADQLEELEDIRNNHKPVVDLQSGDMKIMKNDGEQVASPINIEIYKNQFSPKEWNYVKARTPVHVFAYDVRPEFPKIQQVSTKQGLKDYPVCNLYIPPRWSFQENKGEALMKEHKKMIELRFKNEESLERYFCNMYHVLTNRSKVICGVVNKRQGTGKSMVMGRIPGWLVGMENLAYTDKGFMNNAHKDIILNKRAVFLDEHKLTKGQQAIEKQFTEDMIYVNPKGKPAITIPNNLSWFMASNNYEDIYTEPTDRRHYFLEDSGRHIVEEYGSEFVDTYIKRMNTDDEFVANLGYYILNEFKDFKYAPEAVYRGETFEHVVRATCFPGYEEVISEIESGEVVDGILYSDAKRRYNVMNKSKKEFYPRIDAFNDFFDSFTWKGKRVCHVEKVSRFDAKLVPVDK